MIDARVVVLRMLLCALALAGCGERPERQLHFGTARQIAEARGPIVDGVELVMGDARALALWSDRTGLYARLLHTDGRPRGAPARLGARCAGGLDAVRAEERAVVACLRRPMDAADKAGDVIVLWVDFRANVTRRLRAGPSGRDSEGISLAAGPGGLQVAWHDGTPGRWRARTVRLDEPPQEAEAVSPVDLPAGAPAVLPAEQRSVLVFPQLWLARQSAGQLMATDGHGRPHRLVELQWWQATPRLVRYGAQNDPVVGYRDVREVDRRPGLQLLRLDERLRPRGEPIRIGRANGPDRPDLVPCGDGLMTVVSRSWSSDLVIGVNYLDPHLQPRMGERQIYKWGTNYDRAAGACTPDHRLLVLVAQRGLLTGTDASLHTMILQPD